MFAFKNSKTSSKALQYAYTHDSLKALRHDDKGAKRVAWHIAGNKLDMVKNIKLKLQVHIKYVIIDDKYDDLTLVHKTGD